MTKDEALKLALEALEQLDGLDTETECVTIDVGEVMDTIKEALAQPEHPEQMARLGWQYVECPACGLEGARAFPKPEQPTIKQSLTAKQELGELPDDVDPRAWEHLLVYAPKRQPLTPEWIWTWLMDWCKRNGSSPASYNSLFKMVADARVIEAAHNIKENT